MASATSTFKQDLPPKGGYSPINWRRVPAKSYFSASKLFGIMIFTHFSGFYLYNLNRKKNKREYLEINDAKLAIEPLLWAERDREFLKQIRRNNEEEAKLMKDVPGWVVGTYYGEPIYKTLGENTWQDPIIHEYYVHAHEKHVAENFMIQLTQ